MANCIECHRQIDDGYAFCPDCGADNRPPEARTPLTFCQHNYLPGRPFCTLCGGGEEGYVGMTPTKRHRAVLAWFFLGVGLTCLFTFLILALTLNGFPLASQVQTLFHTTYRHYSRYSYYGYSSNLGFDFSGGVLFAAIFCFVQSYRLDKRLASTTTEGVGDLLWWQFFWF